MMQVPVLLAGLGWYLGAVWPTIGLGLLALLPLRFLPAPLDMETLKGWHAKQIVKYFSFKVSFVEPLPENKAHILVRYVGGGSYIPVLIFHGYC